MKKLLSGNEAIARGAYEYGVKVAAAYPGTPSTEILENLSQYKGIYSEWSPNEKVALEIALGSSFTGIRSLAVMKHVGLNVAADPLMTASYTGVKGGLVIVVADDPGMHSSQNEQDSRNYARFAKIPLFEPSDSSEAKTLLKDALDVSEQFDTPVLYRTTTRVSHSKGIVDLSERVFHDREPEYERNPEKYLMVPGYARKRRVLVEERLKRLTEYSNHFRENKMLCRDRSLGIITSSIAYQYVMEVFEEASVLKLSMSYPFPDELIKHFAQKVEKILVVEELDRFVTEHIKSLGIEVVGSGLIPNIGELNPDILENARRALCKPYKSYKSYESGKKAAGKDERKKLQVDFEKEIPHRPPVLCPGCPHRAVFYTLKDYDAILIGDIGCYSLGGLEPLNSMDAIICMGAGISAALGVSRSGIDRPVVGIIGDSTFFHSGITGLLDIGYNKGNLTIIVLDNRITGMTGHQENPGTGKTLMGEETYQASIERFAAAAGIERIRVFDPYSIKETKEALESEIGCGEPSLLISRRPCILITDKSEPFSIDAEACKSCGICLKIGCPAIHKETDQGENWKAAISPSLCTGCSVCAQLCPFDTISG